MFLHVVYTAIVHANFQRRLYWLLCDFFLCLICIAVSPSLYFIALVFVGVVTLSMIEYDCQ